MPNRIALFLLGCVPLRALFAWSMHRQPRETFRRMAVLACVTVGLGFWVIYLFRLRPTGREVNGELIWWDALRPLHGAFLLWAAYRLHAGQPSQAAALLGADVALGLGSFIVFHTLIRC